MNGDFSEEVLAHMDRARQALAAARSLCGAGLFDDAASRAYYAAFHGASAALMARGLTVRKHGALIGAVHRQLIHGGVVPAETGKWLTWLFELRSVGDYAEIIHVNEQQALLALTRAQQLVETFEGLLRDA